jgi:lipopolysaccharide/colanic/teichoic acid biosynthesis glycosyltransferase
MYRYFIKRLLDVILALILLPIVLVIIIPVSIAIKIEDGGPVFYNGPRLGKNMKQFTMYKLRSMKVNAPDIRNEDGTTFNSSDDPRVTKVGKFIRKTSIDELPQIFNVLKGEMSFIGPRPSPLGDKSIYPKEFFKKFDVLPGITGYNQALLRNNATMEERIKNDSYYVDNISFRLDMKILFMTIGNVVFSKNIYRNESIKEGGLSISE